MVSELTPEHALWYSVLKTYADDADRIHNLKVHENSFVRDEAYRSSLRLIWELEQPWTVSMCNLVDLNSSHFISIIKKILNEGWESVYGREQQSPTQRQVH